jgi:hypothetical protein
VIASEKESVNETGIKTEVGIETATGTEIVIGIGSVTEKGTEISRTNPTTNTNGRQTRTIRSIILGKSLTLVNYPYDRAGGSPSKPLIMRLERERLDGSWLL